MADNAPNNDSNNGEVGIIDLLNYFKNGFKSFFNSVKKLISKLYDVLIQFLILIKNNALYIGSSIVAFVILYFILNQIPSFKNYGYELVVRPNYNSTDALFTNIKSLNELASKPNNGSFVQSLIKAEIEPITSTQAKIQAYYNVIDDDFNLNGFNQQKDRDTIFFREVSIEDFEKNIRPEDYDQFKIKLRTRVPFNSDTIFNYVIKPVEENPSLKTLKDNFLTELEYQKKNMENSLHIIDTILISRTKQSTVSNQESINFDNGNVKILEDELLGRKNDILGALKMNAIQQSEYANIISVLVRAKPAEVDGKIKRDPKYFALYGFLFAIFTILFKRFLKYLDNYRSNS